MRAAATCQGETFAELTILSIEPVSYDAMTISSQGRGLLPCCELKSLLKSFYPRRSRRRLSGHPVPLRR